MTIAFVIVITLVCVLLGVVVLIQNPKGGGLAGSVGGFSNQFMGVKQTTDVLEKGTWIFAAAIGVLCLVSSIFIGGTSTTGSGRAKDIGAPPPAQTAPATGNPAPAMTPVTPGATTTPDSGK